MSKNETHICEEIGCTEVAEGFYDWPVADDVGGGMWFCSAHAVEAGFCLWCGHFGAGSEDYDFSPMKGYHRDCYDELRHEVGETDDDDDDYGWEYPHGWYDPDVPVPDDEDSTHTYIGPDDTEEAADG